MTTTFDSKHVALVLVILITLNVFQTESASLQPNQGSIFSGINRMLRKLPLAPPPPKISQSPHYKLRCPPPPPPPLPPPPSTSEIDRIYPSFRTVRRGSPPAPKASRPRNYRIFLSPPPSPPPPPPPPPPPAWMYRPPSKCNFGPPPPEISI